MFINIKYSNSGLNSKRLILNRFIDIVETKDATATVEISKEVSLEDVKSWIESDLTYIVEPVIMTEVSLRNNTSKEFLSVYVKV